MVRKIVAQTLKAALTDGAEIALVDAREEGIFGKRHMLVATNIPLSRFELEMRDLIPRRSTRIVLCDAGGGEAKAAAALMEAAGYIDLAILDGGIEAWARAGGELYSGVYVPSKAFGEFVEIREHTPNITCEELKAKLDAGEKVVVLDSRPYDEFHAMNIPGGIDTPGAELVYRLRDLAPDPDTLVVVNCAGRTRSIIGCQSLINAGVPNRVMALRNGTMGWHLAGFELELGSQRQCGPVSPEALEWARAAADRVARRFGVQRIGLETLARWQAVSDVRSVYLLDVRYLEEYEAGHLPGSRPAPGGQLVQSTDRYVGTRNARIVLVDDTGVRATMTASWLLQMGWRDVAVLESGLEGMTLECGPYRPEPPELAALDVPMVTAEQLAERLAGGRVAVIDLADSLEFRVGHIPGAWWAIRSRLGRALKSVEAAPDGFVVTSPDGRLARFGAATLRSLTDMPVAALQGGTAAWAGAGHPLAKGSDRMADETVDIYYRPYDGEPKAGELEAAMNRYLTWEVGLVEQMERDGTLAFPDFARG
ncbi:MAG: rhodanese-like domain-containing protein [Alphaproteobacteria bacterium]